VFSYVPNSFRRIYVFLIFTDFSNREVKMTWTEIMKMSKTQIKSKLKAEGYIDDPEMNPFCRMNQREVKNEENNTSSDNNGANGK